MILNNSIHGMWDKWAIIVMRLTPNSASINICNIYFDSINLEVHHPHTLLGLELVQTTNFIKLNAVCTLREESRI